MPYSWLNRGCCRPRSRRTALRKSRTPRALRCTLRTGTSCFASCVLRWAKKRKFPNASARKASCTSWRWNSYSMSIHPSILSGTVGACEAQYGHSLSCGYPPRLEIRSENRPDRCEPRRQGRPPKEKRIYRELLQQGRNERAVRRCARQ